MSRSTATSSSNNRAEIVRAIKRRRKSGRPLNYTATRRSDPRLLKSAQKTFGSWQAAIEAAGWDYDQIRQIRRWSRTEIRRQLRALYRQRDFLDISTLRRKHSKLYGACCRHYGSGLAALEAAGINYERLLSERPNRWSRQKIIDRIQRRHTEGRTLCRNEILHNEPRLNRFCYAATHQFGNWGKALRAAGLNPDKVRNRDGLWPRQKVLSGIRDRYRRHKLLNTDAMLREDLALHAAGRRHFDTWAKAVKAAGIDYNEIRGGLKGWTRDKTKRALCERIFERGVSRRQIQQQSPSLYRAALHHFGSWSAAEGVAGRTK